MALTPDDVVHKQFQHVRFKDGFDPDEVDDYLDEIVVEWRKTIEENTQLKARIAELEAAQGDAPAASEEAPAAEPAPVSAPIPVAEPVPAVPAVAESSESDVRETTHLIEIARRVHDQVIAEGESKRDSLVSEAETRAAEIIADAEARQQEVLGKLNSERASLEAQISDLREFENSYRTQLRSYFEGQLHQLNSEQPASESLPSFGQ